MTGSESFFDALKSKRESQDIEISEICEFTKIQSRYIKAIEQGDFTVLPNVYIRLFLKSYANFIGADSAKALKDYELYTTGKSTRSEELSNKDANVIPLSSASMQDEIDSNLQVSPKQIASGVGIICTILLLLWWASRVTEEQTEKIKSNEHITEVLGKPIQNDGSEVINLESNLSKSSSHSNSDQSMNAKIVNKTEPLPDKLPLNKNNFLPKKIDSEITQKIKLYPPFSISIITLQETKINLSKTENSQISELINQTVQSGQEFNFDFTSTINFEFWSSSQISVKLNKTSIDNFLRNSDGPIRGSYEAKKSQLYLSFYKR